MNTLLLIYISFINLIEISVTRRILLEYDISEHIM